MTAPALKSLDRIEAMRGNGMSATAIRRALGLSPRQAVAAGIEVGMPAPVPVEAPTPPLEAPPIKAEESVLDRGPRMTDVLDAVAAATGIARAELLAVGQRRHLSALRQLAMLLIRENCAGASFPVIGHFLSLDHTTVIYGCRAAQRRLEHDRGYRGLRDKALRSLHVAGECSERGAAL